AYEIVLVPALAAGATPLAQLEQLTIGIAGEGRRLTDKFGFMPGCPFGHLAGELSTTDGPVRERLARLFDAPPTVLPDLPDGAVPRHLLDGGGRAGELPAGPDPEEAAQAPHAYTEGAQLISKTANAPAIVRPLLPLALRLAVPAVRVEPAAT